MSYKKFNLKNKKTKVKTTPSIKEVNMFKVVLEFPAFTEAIDWNMVVDEIECIINRDEPPSKYFTVESRQAAVADLRDYDKTFGGDNELCDGEDWYSLEELCRK